MRTRSATLVLLALLCHVPLKAVASPSPSTAPRHESTGGLLFRALDQPDIQPADVVLAWIAADLEATPHVDVPLLMALMWPESRYQPTAGPACGVMQVYPHDIGLDDASSCALWKHDVRAGVRAGVIEIEMLLADHRVHNLREALLYRACGNKAFVPGACLRGAWVDQVFVRRAYLAGSSRPKS